MTARQKKLFDSEEGLEDNPEKISGSLREGKVDLDKHIEETKGLSYKKSALRWFKKKNLGKAVTSEELAQIEGKSGTISHNIRRIFELRDEDGYKLVNHKDNDETGLDLNRDEWVLLEPEPDPSRVRPRGVDKKIRWKVLSRDGFQCQFCGRERRFRPV